MSRLRIALILIGALPLTWHLRAQQLQTEPPRFEAASLKVAEGTPMGWSTSGRVGQRGFTHIPLKECLKIAFGVQDYSLVGPPWLDSVRLDIVAKPSADAPPNQFNSMLQTLLVDRFKIEFHRETRSIDGYALVPFKNGMPETLFNKREINRAGSFGSTDAKLWGYGVTTTRLSEMLAASLRQPVEDRTAVTAVFDFALEWKPLDARTDASDDPGPSIFTALREQLGLTLTKTRIPVEVLVIDKLNRTPTEN